MGSLLTGLQEDIKAYHPLSREDAVLYLESTLFTIERLIYGRALETLQSAIQQKDAKSIDKLMKEMGFTLGKNANLKSTQLYCIEMIKTYAKVSKILEKQEPFESLHLEIKRLIEDNLYFIKEVLNGNTPDFFEKEMATLKQLLKVIHPFLDPDFKKIEHFYTFVKKNDGMQIHFGFGENTFPQYFEIKRTFPKFNDMVSYLLENQALLKNYNDTAYQQLSTDAALIGSKLSIYNTIITMFHTALMEPRYVNNVDLMLPLIRNVFECYDSIKLISSNVDILLEKSRQQVLHANTPAKPTLKKVENQDDEYGIEAVNDFTRLFEEEAKKKKTAEPAMPAVNEDEPTETIKGNTAKQVVKDIFDPVHYKHVKYDDLVNLIENLHGFENNKTKSSSRKLHLPHTTLFPHERHGRDRKDYADPQLVKHMRNALLAIGVTPDNLTFRINPVSKV